MFRVRRFGRGDANSDSVPLAKNRREHGGRSAEKHDGRRVRSNHDKHVRERREPKGRQHIPDKDRR